MTHYCLPALTLLVMLALVSRPAAAAGAAGANLPPIDKLPAIAELPDPFLFADGSRVKAKEDWARRRDELKAMILYYEFGQMPPAPGSPPAATEISSAANEELAGTEVSLLLTLGQDRKIQYHLDLTVPKGKAGRLPVLLTGDLGWGKVKTKGREGAVKDMMRRGYVLAEFNREEVSPDGPDRTKGVYSLFPDCDGAAEAAWAWGYARTIDYLLTRPDIDPARIAATGHSRGGKAALLAGALDERIALTCPNGSGAGGAGCYRFQAKASEDLEAIAKRFPFWFTPRFQEFVGKVDRLPYDHHEIEALVAPRALLSTEALGDLWANPEGTQQTYTAAKEVYKFLGAADKIGIHFRKGQHEQDLEDWTALLDFADRQFFGKASPQPFDKLAFPESPRQFKWAAPETK